MWRFIRLMCAVCWLRLLAGKRSYNLKGKRSALWLSGQTPRMFMEERGWCWLLTRRGCLNRKGPAGEAAARAEAAAQVEAEVVTPAAELAGPAAPEALGERVVKAEQAEQAEQAGREARAVPEEHRGERPAAQAGHLPIIQIRFTRSRGPSFRNFLPQRRPISRFWQRWRRELAGSRSLTQTICWEGLRRSDASKTSFIFWGTCRRRR